jgi:hypothetical protein
MIKWWDDVELVEIRLRGIPSSCMMETYVECSGIKSIINACSNLILYEIIIEEYI